MTKENKLPEFLQEKICSQYGELVFNEIMSGFNANRKTSFRVNTLKSSRENVLKEFKENNLNLKNVSFYKNAFLVENAKEDLLINLNCYKNGEIYLQSLSSMLPPLVMNPQKNSEILDMCSAPGGKTTLMAVLTENQANIMACEVNKIRAERLKYNIAMQGTKKINIFNIDASKLDDFYRFDKILLDAPCSGSGTIQLSDEKSYKNISKAMIEKLSKIQKQLLKKALTLVKVGGEILYSTCSIFKEENEEVVKDILKQFNAEIVPINNIDDKEKNIHILDENLPQLPTSLQGAITIKPTNEYEGFFIVKLRKIK